MIGSSNYVIVGVRADDEMSLVSRAAQFASRCIGPIRCQRIHDALSHRRHR